MVCEAEGEIWVSGRGVSPGYYNNSTATNETFVMEGGKRFLRTGDVGAIDAEGFLRISGRIKENYKLQNGKFVSPAQVLEIRV